MSVFDLVVLVLIVIVAVIVVVSFQSVNNYTGDDANTIIDHLKLNAEKDVKKLRDQVKADSNLTEEEKSSDVIQNFTKIISKKPVDRNLEITSFFCPEDSCPMEIIKLIEGSKRSIDCAIYDIDLTAISDALISANDKNLSVRIVTDLERSKTKDSKIGILKGKGIKVVTNPQSNKAMHNKFCVFDGKIVYLGSMNFTTFDGFKNNNNLLVIEDKEVSSRFTEKFERMFTGNFYENTSLLETQENEDYYSIGNIEVYFCPQDNCEEKVLEKFSEISSYADCMFFSYTLDSLGDKMVDMKKDKFSLRVIVEKVQNENNKYSEYDKLVDKNINIILDKNPDFMHHKFCVLDGEIVMTGSMNPTNNGITNNEETLVFVRDSVIASAYESYFEKYWEKWES